MENESTVSLAELEGKLASIEQKIASLEEERIHLRWFIEKYGKRSQRSGGSTMTAGGMEMLEAVKDVLRNAASPMKSQDIHEALLVRGMNVNKNSFDSRMSIWARDAVTPIVKPAYGRYMYQEKGF